VSKLNQEVRGLFWNGIKGAGMKQLTPSEILAKLDPEQRIAVEAPIGPVRIIAGAGTGKTRTLIHRIAYWDAMGMAPSEKTLSVTHSNKSAAELRHRLKELGVQKINAQTFHAAAKKQLEDNWRDLSIYWRDKGYRDEFPVIITDSSKIRAENQYWLIRGIVQSIIKQADMRSTQKRDFDTELNQAVNAELILLRARMISIGEYEKDLSGKEKIGILTRDEFVRFYKKYTKSKISNNQVDFADLLEMCILMLRENPDVAAKIHSQYEHFLVDEFQDNDPVQDELLTQWLGTRKSICVVGDPRQTIYSFKGSEPALLNNFGEKYPRGVTVELVRNYRSTPQIVAWANRLMHGTSASGGAKSDLLSMETRGPEPVIIECESETAEQKEIAEKVKALLTNTKTPQSQIAILVRINSNIPIFRQNLKKFGIQTKSPGDTFWEDVLPIMKQLQRESESSQENGLAALHEILLDQGWTLEFEAGEKFDAQKQQRKDNANALIALAETLTSEEIASPLSLAKGFAKMRDEARDDHDSNAVTVTTIHKAKGMEWDAVLLPKFVDGVIPISFAKTPLEIDEERRLAYVAITRARKYLLISWGATYLTMFGNVKSQTRSRFLSYMEENKPNIDLTNPKLSSTVKTDGGARIKLSEPLTVGNRVHNAKYGLGTVISIDGSSVIIDFGSLGKKTFKKTSSTVERL
jgi:DNA helicase-2/ATP-dependent DNA helicase PcrA